MLVRSARQRQPRRTAQALAASFAQLNLPWLAPSQLRWNASQAASALHAAPRVRRRTPAQRSSSKTHAQPLATAATEPYRPDASIPAYAGGYRDGYTDPTPEQGWQSSQTAQPASERGSGWLPPHTTDPFTIPSPSGPPKALSLIAATGNSTTMDLLQYLRTSLQVGRQSRAEAILKRLADTRLADSPELSYAHASYLESLFNAAAESALPDESLELSRAMEEWYQTQIVARGVTITGPVLIPMIRATIMSELGSAREQKIRALLETALEQGEEVYDEVVFSDQYDDDEFTILGAISSPYYDIANDPDPKADAILDAFEAQLEPGEDATIERYRRWDAMAMDDLPQVLATDIKGPGLEGVKKFVTGASSLEALPASAPIDQQRGAAIARQYRMEATATEIAMDRWRETDEGLKKMGISQTMQQGSMNSLMWQWYQALLPELKKELALCRKVAAGPRAASRVATEREKYATYLDSVPIEITAATAILVVTASISTRRHKEDAIGFEVKVGPLTSILGESIQDECHLRAARLTGTRKINSRILKRRISRLLKTQNMGEAATDTGAAGPMRRKPRESSPHFSVAGKAWSTQARVWLGAMLLGKLIETAQLPVTRLHPRTKENVTQMQPAFLHKVVYVRGKKVGVITPNTALIALLQKDPVASTIAKRQPMIVEPKPWTGWAEGGYLTLPSQVMRLPDNDKTAKLYMDVAHERGDLTQVYASLTALGKVPWKIHHGVLKTQIEAWNTGQEIANFAPLNTKLELPPEPAVELGTMERRKWLAEVRQRCNQRSGDHSRRSFQNFQLEVARGLANDTLYFPHSIDFRGRAYPIPPYLNHMGADNVRGLLVFAEGKPLGEGGLRWLKIHLATVAGHDKASLEERVQFADQHIDDVYDSVRDPLGGRRWWLEAEDAWQTLAACFELAAALDTPDPATFVSHLPIQQDGTCNGLQHYAALGGDALGAAQVNLEPGDRPNDVYGAVLRAVEKQVSADAAVGHPCALKLNGKITRKCVKQPVMTNVYGVTFYGAKEQVARQLETIFPEIRPYDEVNMMLLSAYLADLIFRSLGELFGGAQAIQRWLGICASRIAASLTPEQVDEYMDAMQEGDEEGLAAANAKGLEAATSKKSKGSKPAEAQSSEKAATSKKSKRSKPEEGQSPSADGSPGRANVIRREQEQALRRRLKQRDLAREPVQKTPVVWTTPLRMPVCQPYRDAVAGRNIIKTKFQSINLHEPQIWHAVNRRKQLQAFPPNFIHSLDATHMMLSVLRCSEVGITFASIHDSFWCHASDVPRMSELLREAFIAMHRENIVGRLREEFVARYKGHMTTIPIHFELPVAKEIIEWRVERGGNRGDIKTQLSELRIEMERLRLLRSDDPVERAKGEAMVTPASIAVKGGIDPTDFLSAGDVGSLGFMSKSKASADGEGVGAAEPDATDLDTAVDAVAEDDIAKTFKRPKRANQTRPGRVSVWMPLEFPHVPEKGDFDITRLSTSKYFFH